MRFQSLPAPPVTLILLSITLTNALSHAAPSLQQPLTLSTANLETLRHATSAYHTLQAQYYNYATGLYNTTGWWNAANIITVIANLAVINPDVSEEIKLVLENTYQQAPKSAGGAGYEKILDAETFLYTTRRKRVSEREFEVLKRQQRSDDGWLNDYYEDEAWWALAWLRTYDLTSNSTYLNTCISIFNDLYNALPTPCGGIWWNKAHTYVNAITNELFLTVAANLANRASTQLEKDRYLTIAKAQWTWFLGSRMMNEMSNINDGLSRDCLNNRGAVWSYNQGVILEGLAELWTATNDTTYLDYAIEIANSAFRRLSSPEGILTDVCERNLCGADGVQFKGIFMRGLMVLNRVLEVGDGKERILEFVRRNADSVWKRDRDEMGRIGVGWSGPLREISAGSMGSGLDALVAGADMGSIK